MQTRLRFQQEIDARNQPLTDDDLDAMFPKEGYTILEPPPSYQPIRTPSRKLLATPTPMGETPAFSMGATPDRGSYGIAPETSETGLPTIKPEDFQYFGKLAEDVGEGELSAEDARERKIMRLLLKIKSGQPAQRKVAMRQITDKAREFGAEGLFNQILPLLMSPTLEDQERHLLVKVIDRVLYKLDDLVRPYVHKILVVIEPLLIDEDYYARVEVRSAAAAAADDDDEGRRRRRRRRRCRRQLAATANTTTTDTSAPPPPPTHTRTHTPSNHGMVMVTGPRDHL
jgi:splicing factor 3B subunit 1